MATLIRESLPADFAMHLPAMWLMLIILALWLLATVVQWWRHRTLVLAEIQVMNDGWASYERIRKGIQEDAAAIEAARNNYHIPKHQNTPSVAEAKTVIVRH